MTTYQDFPLRSITRPFAIVLAALLLSVQVYLLQHETEHAIHGENEECASCWVASHQHAAISLEPVLAPAVFSEHFIERKHDSLFHALPLYYASRAPPAG